MVDVVAVDLYDSNLEQGLRMPYDSLTTLNKPFGLGEYGCMSSSDWFWESRYVHDFTGFATDLKKFPRLSFFLAWNLHWGLSFHQNIDVLKDSLFINKKQLKRLMQRER